MKFSAESTNKFRKAVVVDTDLCIGCGVCVHKCPAKSITLKRRATITRPPKTGMDLMRINHMARQAARQNGGSSQQSGTTPVPQSIGDAFDMMALAFKPGAAAGLDVVFQFNISGDAGGDWCITIKDQTCEIKKGLTDSPTTTIGISDEDYIKMLSKQVEPATLLSTGKLKIEGDMTKAQVLDQVFSHNKNKCIL